MAAGIVFSLLAAVVLNTGNLVQKQAVSTLQSISARRSGHLVRTVITSRLWMAGFALCLIGVGLQVMAFALAPISVVQTIFNAGIVLLIVLSRVKLGERLQRIEWFGLAIVVVSLVGISASLGTSVNTIGLTGSGTRILVAAAPTLFVVAGIVYLIRTGRGSTGFLYGIAAGLLYGTAALGTKGASTIVVHDGVAHSVDPILTSVYPYVFLVFSALGMLLYQTGLQRFRIAVVGPMSDVVCSTYVVAVGMVAFGASLPSDRVTLVLRLGGFVGVLAGSVLVAGGGSEDGTRGAPSSETDLGLGPILTAEVDSLTGHSADEIVAGTYSERRS